MRLVALGLGYTARAFVRRVAPAAVVGTSRSADGAAARSGLGTVLVPGLDDAALDAAIADATHILVSAGPGRDGDPFLARVTAARTHAPKWIGYLSTIGVYGDTGGAWISEDDAFEPTSERASARLAAEAAWQTLGERLGTPVAVFRLGGIYGPGRNPFVALSEGRARRIDKPGQVFNRIHVDDIARVLAASACAAAPVSRVYNVTDGAPSAQPEVVAYAAQLMGVEAPPLVPFEAAELSPMAQAFYADTKRVRSDRIREELGVMLRYRSYREGLRALWAGGWRAADGSPTQ